MYKNIYKLILLIPVLLLVLISCKENSTGPAKVNQQYSDSGKKAIVIVVENNDIVGISDENMYNTFRGSLLPIFSKLFNVPVKDMQNLTLHEIINKYGEKWQMRQIDSAAQNYYDKIITLNDSTATVKCLIDSLKMLKSGGYTIDMVFNLHGSQTSVLFSNGSIEIGVLTGLLKSNSINIRALYQTCCYGKFMTPAWEELGIYAVNGAEGTNNIALFSAAFFIKQWTSGKTFEDAVFTAYDLEIQELRKYNSDLPIDTYILTPDNLTNSIQTVAGKDSHLLWKNIPLVLF